MRSIAIFWSAFLPALGLGIALQCVDGTAARALTQGAFAVVALVLSLAAQRWDLRRIVTTRPEITLGVVLVILLATFFDAGIAGVHRWIGVGGVRIHAGDVVGAIAVSAFGRSTRRCADLLFAAILLVTIAQPDAALATALAAAGAMSLSCARRGRVASSDSLTSFSQRSHGRGPIRSRRSSMSKASSGAHSRTAS